MRESELKNQQLSPYNVSIRAPTLHHTLAQFIIFNLFPFPEQLVNGWWDDGWGGGGLGDLNDRQKQLPYTQLKGGI